TGHAGLVAGAPLRWLRRLGRWRATAEQRGAATRRFGLWTHPREWHPRLHVLLGRPRLRLLGRMRSRSMRTINAFTLAVMLLASAGSAAAQTSSAASSPGLAVGAQYDTTHVYVAPEDFDRFVTSVVATFGGTTSKQGVVTVTPTPSSTMS